MKSRLSENKTQQALIMVAVLDLEDISDDEITRIPLRKSQHVVSIDESKDTMVIIITPLKMYGENAQIDGPDIARIAADLANPVQDARNSIE